MDNYVSISLKATDGAKPDLDALKLALDELKDKVATAKADVDTKDGQAKLLALEATLDAVSKKVASPRIDVAGASRALAQVAAVDVALDDLKAKSDKQGAEGVIGRFLGGSGGSGGLLSGLAGILGKLPLVGSQLEGIGQQAGQASGEAGGLVESLGSVAGSGAGIAGVAAAIGAVVTEAAALATGLTAAGLGAGAFAALAIPAFKDVEGQYQKLNAANQKYQQAVALEKLDPSKAHASAVKAALDQVNLVGQAYQKLPDQEQGAVDGIYKLTQAFQAQAKAFQPAAFKVFNEGLQIANKLLPYLGQFANAAAPAIEGLLTQFSKGLDSPAFKQFAGFLESLSGPAITAIGSGMAGLAKDVMQLMEQFSKKDVINSINIAFRLVGFALTAVIDIIKVSMGAWDLLTKAIHVNAAAFDTVRHDIATAGHDIAGAFDAVRHAAATFGHDVASAFDTARHGVATAADGIKNAVVSAVTRVVTTVKNDWKAVASWLVNPVATAVFEIRTHTHEIAADFDAMRHDVAAILAGARHDIAGAWDGIRHDVAATVDAIPGDIRKQWDAIRHDAAALGNDVLKAMESAWTSIWHSITSTTASGAAQVAGFFQKLPGQITGFFKSLPGDLERIGENIIIGLYNGIVKQFNSLISSITNLAKSISNAFTNPLSIFSPSRVFMSHGENIVLGAVAGVQQAAPKLRGTMSQLGAQVAQAGLGRGAGGLAATGGLAGGGQVQVQLAFANTSGDKFMQWLRETVRQQGGDPAMFQKKVAFA